MAIRANNRPNPPAKAQRVIATLQRSSVNTIVISDPEDAAKFFRELIADRAEEFFIAAYLNVRNRIVSFEEYTAGSVANVEVHVGGVFRGALLAGAAGMVTCHNHPSGVGFPSDDDIRIWRRLTAAGEIMGVPVLDHMIITPDRHYSMQEHGG